MAKKVAKKKLTKKELRKTAGGGIPGGKLLNDFVKHAGR